MLKLMGSQAVKKETWMWKMLFSSTHTRGTKQKHESESDFHPNKIKIQTILGELNSSSILQA